MLPHATTAQWVEELEDEEHDTQYKLIMVHEKATFSAVPLIEEHIECNTYSRNYNSTLI